MKYTARGESRLTNIASGEAKCYLSRDPHQERILSYKQNGSALSVFLYFKLKDVLTEDI